MYKLLLCWRYLRSRYIALASIVSVMLGVATMIVVNAVMAGFSFEMQDRIHNILSDVVLESRSLEGMCDAEWHMNEIRRVVGDDVAGMTPTAHVPAMLQFAIGSESMTKQVNVIGIDPATYARVSSFGQYLQHPENRQLLDFGLREKGYDVIDPQAKDPSKAVPRKQLEYAGWAYRRQKAKFASAVVVETETESPARAADPFLAAAPAVEAGQGTTFDPATQQHVGCVMGIGICSYRGLDGADNFLLLPGDDVDLTYPSAGKPPRPLSARFTVVDFYESKMAEYDSGFLFVPLTTLQDLRGMVEPQTGRRFVNTIQIRCNPGVDLDAFRDKLRAHFPERMYLASTWRDKQGALLAAVQMERAVLNVLLFLIIAVAGFGILAIFFMIVVEKTRDIGVLKSLGASRSGVLGIFLTYGTSLGVVGAGVGVACGLAFVRYINEIADLLGKLTGQPVFDPSIYYFYEIPAKIEPLTVGCIAVGAMLIAVSAAVLPARRAALLHPVEALRHQ